MHRLLVALGTAALTIIAAPAQASPVSLEAIRSLNDDELAYAKKGGWHDGGKGWKHGRAWGHRRGWGPPYGRAHGYWRKRAYGYRW